MNSIFRAVGMIGLLTLCNVGVLMAAAPVSDTRSAPSAEQAAATKKTAEARKATVAKKKRASARKKSRSAREVAQTKLPPAQLDLSLPSDMVRHLQPIGTMPKPKSVPLLPPMFGDKPTDNSAFQINGRLLSNEMKLQLRNEERRDVEGAALDFEFKQ